MIFPSENSISVLHLPGAPAAPTEGPPPCGGYRAAQPPAGLVKLKASHTLTPQTVVIDTEKARLTRMRRSLTWSASLIQHALGQRGYKPAMLTLTYRDVDGFEPCHVSNLLNRIRGWLERRGKELHYVWVAELQKRGALHYHLVIWLPRGLTLPKPDKQGWWPHGSTRIEWARNPIGYLIKYTTKFDSKFGLPKGARLHGSGGFEASGKQIRRWLNLPTWLKRLAGVCSTFVRIKGCGLVERDTGVCMQSPWRVSCRGGVVTATELFSYIGGLRDVCGPYSMIDGGIAW